MSVFNHPAQAQEKLGLRDGSVFQYFLALPENSTESTWPLAVFMGGGTGNKPISHTVYQSYARVLADLGWVVAVPISPDNRSFRDGNLNRVRELIEKLKLRDDVLPGKTLLAGISAGGMSALEIARLHPEEVLGIMAVPALVRNSSDLDSLAGIPVYLRIGSNDELGWGMQYEATVNALKQAGVILDADLLYGESHMFGLDWDRVEVWLSTLR